ncbi:hypothetical protein D3C76_597370 [compost metagenome]
MVLERLGVNGLPVAHHQQGKGSLAPLRVGDTHHRHFAHRRVTADQVFEVKRRYPLAAGLDHILDAIADIDVTHAIEGRDVTGVQPAALPQLLALFRLLEVAHGQPRGSQHQFALGLAIGREEIALAVDDRRFHQGHRHAGLDPVGDALILAAGLQFVVQVRGRNQRAGLGHAVRRRQLDTARQCSLVQRPVKRTAADDDLPATEVLALGAGAIEQHLQDGRHAMGEGDFLFTPQLDQHVRLVAPRVHLLHAKHGGGVRDAPGMHVEHRGDGHVHIVAAQQAHAVDAAGDRGFGQGVQHQLPVAEVHALGVAGGAGGVEGGGHRVLVEVREVVARAGSGQQLLVLADQVGQLGGLVRAIGQQQGLVDGGQLPGDGLVQADEVAVDQHHAVFGVVHGVEDLLRRQAHVDGVHHRADHRDGEHAFQVAMAVPVHHRHRVTGLDPGFGQDIGQASDTLVELWISQAQLIAINDLAGFLVTAAGHQQAFDQQRVGVGAFGGFDDAGLQHGYPFSEKRAGQVWIYCSSSM